MKLSILSLPFILLVGCSSAPQHSVRVAAPVREPARYATDREIERLREQARENFEKMRAQMGGGSLPIAQGPRRQAQPASESGNDEMDSTVTVRSSESRDPNQTQYWNPDADRGLSRQDRRSRKQAAMEAYESEYARAFGKRRDQITREERAWIRSKFDL